MDVRFCDELGITSVQIFEKTLSGETADLSTVLLGSLGGNIPSAFVR
jgi:hypothetical protein